MASNGCGTPSTNEKAGEAVPGTSEQPPISAPVSSPLDASHTSQYDNICGICFTDINPIDNPRGRINSCDHLFCSYCIKEWAKNTNVCPSCKARFTRIFTAIEGKPADEVVKVRRRNYSAWEQSYFAESDGETEEEQRGLTESVVCQVCHQGHSAARIIFCDRRQCTYTAHLDCLGVAERPLTFLCASCERLRSTAHLSSPRASGSPQTPRSPPVAQQDTTASSAPRPARSSALSTEANPQAPPPRPSTAPAPTQPRKVAMRPPSDWFQRLTAGVLRREDLYPHQGRQESAEASDNQPVASPPPIAAPPAGPVDLSKPHAPAPSSFVGVESDETPYFLAYNAHAAEARRALEAQTQSRQHEATQRRLRAATRMQRAQSASTLAATARQREATALLRHRGSGNKRARSRPPPAGASAETSRQHLEVAESELLDPQRRQALEDRMTCAWAVDIVPVLRQRQSIADNQLRFNADGGIFMSAPPSAAATAARENQLWQQALQQSRQMVRVRLDTDAMRIRAQKERWVRIEAQREAAALAKLGRIIALRRQHQR